jgi:hypothetical protein
MPRPFVDSCRSARPITEDFPGPRDLAVGPLSYAGLRAFGPPPRAPNWHGGYFYKSGAQLRAGVSVTVRITEPAARYAVLVTESGPVVGLQAVTYRACVRSEAAGYWWVGGFVLRGRRTGCVPIEVTAAGASKQWHTIVPLGVPSCP